MLEQLPEGMERFVSWAVSRVRKGNGALLNISWEDCYQEGWVGLLTARDRYRTDRGATFATYAANVIKNRLLNLAHKESSRKTQPLPQEDLIDPKLSKRGRGRDINLDDVFALIPPHLKEWVYARYVEGMTIVDAGKVAGVSQARSEEYRREVHVVIRDVLEKLHQS